MSFTAIAWAWETPLKHPAKLVLLALANRADDKGECFPSVSTIAADLGMSSGSRNRIRRGLDVLEELGYIKTFAQFAGKGQQTSNRYRLSVGFIHEPVKKLGGASSTRGAYSTTPKDERPVRQAGAQRTPGASSTGVGAYSTTNQSTNPTTSPTSDEHTHTREELEDLEADFADERSAPPRRTAEDFFARLQRGAA